MNYCQYHPLVEAESVCDACDCHFCLECCDESPLQRNPKAQHQCFLCGEPLTKKESSVEIEPFWRRLPEVYKYPLSLSPVIAILLASLISTMFAYLFILQLIPMAIITLYGFACLRETAEGKLEAPDAEHCLKGSLAPILYVLIIMIIVSFSASFIASQFGFGLGIMAGGFYVLTLPAVVMLVAITGKFLPALDIQRLAGIVKVTGTSYFVMLLFLTIMFSSVAALSSFLFSSPVGLWGLFLYEAIDNYYMIVSYHLLGYLVYQNHEALGFHVSSLRLASAKHEIRSDQKRIEAKLDVLIKSGKYSQAKSLAMEQLRSAEMSVWHWDRAFRLMHAGHSTQELARFLPRYLTKLQDDDRLDDLADAYVSAKKRMPDCQIESHEMRLLVAQSLFDCGRYKYVANLLKGFHSDSKDRAQITKALSLLSDSFSRIPGMEKNEKAYRQMLALYAKGS